MIQIASVPIIAEASVIGVRRRVQALALELGFDDVACTRLATVTSEIGRVLLRLGGDSHLSVALTGGIGGRTGVALMFACPETLRDLALWEVFFDSLVRGVTKSGSVQVTATAWCRRASHGGVAHVDEAFIERQREIFRSRTRDELLEEIREQNRALERHQGSLEETIETRTAEARAAREAAENASRAKSQFLSNMSHELRTPLNGVLGYAQILRRDPTIVGEQRRSLDAIENCGEHLLTLINDVLDLSKIEAGHLELDLRPTKMIKLVESVRDIVLPRANSQGLTFEIMSDADLPPALVTDATKLKQVLVNLLGNAVKFTQEGGVRLEIERTTDERVLYHVRDTGIGMTPEEQLLVFQPFKQAEGGRTSGGTGLGLAISRKICEALGGELRLESERGIGSCFTADLPLQAADNLLSDSTLEVTQAGDDDLVLAPGQDVSVLVVDDVEVNRDVLINVLEAAGFATLSAENGQVALDVLATEFVDLVLMDVRMPVMDGMEATRRIRSDPALAKLKVIAVTADAFSDFRERATQGGFDAFLAKPLRMSQLFRTLRKQLRVEWVSRRAVGLASSTSLGVGENDAGTAAIGEDAVLDSDFAADVAERLAEAAHMGDIGLFETVAEDLDGRGAPGLAARIRAAVNEFEFEAAAAVADDLNNAPESAS